MVNFCFLGYTDFGSHEKPSYDGHTFDFDAATFEVATPASSTSTTTTSTTSTTTTPSCPPRQPTQGEICNVPPKPAENCPWVPGTSGKNHCTTVIQ